MHPIKNTQANKCLVENSIAHWKQISPGLI